MVIADQRSENFHFDGSIELDAAVDENASNKKDMYEVKLRHQLKDTRAITDRKMLPVSSGGGETSIEEANVFMISSAKGQRGSKSSSNCGKGKGASSKSPSNGKGKDTSSRSLFLNC